MVLDLFMLVDDDVDFENDKVDGTDDIKDIFMVFCISFHDRLSDNLSYATIFTQVSYISFANELEIVRELKMDKMVINEKRGVPTINNDYFYCLFVLCGDFCSSIFNSFLIS